MGPAAFGSINNLTKACGTGHEKVSEFLLSKDSYTKYKGIRRKFSRLNAHARYIDEIWCLDLAQMDKLSRWKRGINFFTHCCRCLFSIPASSISTEKNRRGHESSFYQNVFNEERVQVPEKNYG